MFTFNMRRITLLCGCGGGRGCSGLQAGLASPSIAQSLGAPSLSPLQMWPSPHPILPSQRIQAIPSMEGPAGSRAQAAAHMAHHVGCTCVTLRSGLGSANPHGTLREGSSPQSLLLTLAPLWNSSLLHKTKIQNFLLSDLDYLLTLLPVIERKARLEVQESLRKKIEGLSW